MNCIQFMGSKQYTDFAGRLARWIPSQKGGERIHLASLVAKSVCIEKHPKWVQIVFSGQELKRYGEQHSLDRNFFLVGLQGMRASHCYSGRSGLRKGWGEEGKKNRKPYPKMIGEGKKTNLDNI